MIFFRNRGRSLLRRRLVGSRFSLLSISTVALGLALYILQSDKHHAPSRAQVDFVGQPTSETQPLVQLRDRLLQVAVQHGSNADLNLTLEAAAQSKAVLGWEEAIRLGTDRLNKLNGNCDKVSTFLSPSDFGTYGYESDVDELSEWIPQGTERIIQDIGEIATALQGFGVTASGDSQDYYGTVAMHNKKWDSNEPTYADFYNAIGKTSGILIAMKNVSPKYAIINKQQLEPDWTAPKRPDLQAWSDVGFLQWQDAVNRDDNNLALDGLSVVVRYRITNGDTFAILQQAVGNGWDGSPKQFLPGTDAFNAIVGTPNGGGPVFMLSQHVQTAADPPQPILGKKTLSKIVVMYLESLYTFAMVFEDAPSQS